MSATREKNTKSKSQKGKTPAIVSVISGGIAGCIEARLLLLFLLSFP